MKHLPLTFKLVGMFIGVFIVMSGFGLLLTYIQNNFGIWWNVIPVFILIFGMCYVFAWEFNRK